MSLLSLIWGQNQQYSGKTEIASLPSSFLIGEYELSYDRLLEKYNKSLIGLCDYNNDKAFEIWTTVLEDLSSFAKESSVELNGLKLWFNVFFDEDGRIRHIVYYPKPNSKNVDFDKLTLLFSTFCKQYKMKVSLKDKCMLSANASFPLYYKK